MNKIVVLFLGLMLFSCSDNSTENTTITTRKLLGKWNLKGETVNNGAFNSYSHDCVQTKDFQEFFSSGKLTFNGFDAACILNDTQTSNWVLNGNILTVSNENFDPMIYQYVYIIEYLSDNDLLLKQTIVEPSGTNIYRTSFTRN